MNNTAIIAFEFIVLIFSVIIHEVSHGVVAEKLGDPTARLAGRLTLNPLKHLDPVGSLLLPIVLAVSGLPVIGWAKPVPYNPFALKNPKVGAAQIAAAGPISNLALAAIFGIGIRIADATNSSLLISLAPFFLIIITINIFLAVFNLVPIPPLDGSKVLFALLPSSESGDRFMRFLEQYGLVLIIFFVFYGFRLIIPVVEFLIRLFTGL